jgi:hypothetical protein
VYLLVFHAYVNEMHGSRSKMPRKILVHIYIYIYMYVYDVKFLALLGPPYIYDVSRLRVKGFIVQSPCECGGWPLIRFIRHLAVVYCALVLLVFVWFLF